MTTPFVARNLRLVLLVFACASASAEKLTIERIFAAPDLSGASLRAVKFSPDGHRIVYLRGKEDDKNRLDLWAYDVASGKHSLLVDSARLEPEVRALSAEEAQRRERQRTAALSGILEYQFSADSHLLLVSVGGDLYVYDLQAQSAAAVRRLTHTESYETDAHFSPLGHYVSFIRDQNLIVYNLATSTETPVTREGGSLVSFGMAEFVAQEEMNRNTGYWWSPDEKRIAYARVDDSPVAEIQRFEMYADRLEVVKQRYPATGARNALVQLFVAPVGRVAGAERTQVDLGTDPDFYLARVDWFPDSSAIAVQRQSRDQQTLTLLRADPVSGATRELLAEHSDRWIDLHDELTFLKHSPRFIWASSRTGFKHLYLYDLEGKLIRPLTSGEWAVVGDGDGRALRGVDERRNVVYFMANAATPIERHLYSVPLDGPPTTMRRITEASGWHSTTMADDAHVFLDTFSTPERPPSLTLRSADGALRAVIVANELNADHPYAPYLSEHRPVEFGTIKASDGQTLHYQLFKPRDLVPGRRYPVVVDVYGGPGVQRVRRTWEGNFFHQYLAQHGYVVFTLDNRGTSYRGAAFEGALYLHMASVEVADQVTGVDFLKSLPYVDPARIGIFGWSYGGYMTLMCMLKAPQVFAAGVAGAPPSDWRLYDTHYTERYMSTPVKNPEGYADAIVLNHAQNLRAPLLVIHGMADDNVLFTHSTALFKKFQDFGKPFDVMPYPGSKHGLLQQALTGPHAYTTVARFFDIHLKSGE